MSIRAKKLKIIKEEILPLLKEGTFPQIKKLLAMLENPNDDTISDFVNSLEIKVQLKKRDTTPAPSPKISDDEDDDDLPDDDEDD